MYEILQVMSAHAVIGEDTVMIHKFNAAIAPAAVVDPLVDSQTLTLSA